MENNKSLKPPTVMISPWFPYISHVPTQCNSSAPLPVFRRCSGTKDRQLLRQIEEAHAAQVIQVHGHGSQQGGAVDPRKNLQKR
jgi:hypothetical protein